MSKPKSTMRPTLEKLLASLEQEALRHVPIDPLKPGGAKQPRLRSLLVRAREVFEIDRATGPARPDGFPASTPGNGSPGSGKGGGSTMLIKDPSVKDDPGERVPASSVELAALAESRADPLRKIAREIESELRSADSALQRVAAAIDRWDRLRATTELENPPQCHVASVLYQLPFDEKWEPHKRTRFDGVLASPWKEERPVCRMVYDFTRDHGRLPSRDEMTQYLARAAVRVQTGTSTTRQAS